MESTFSKAKGFSKPIHRDPPLNLAERRKRRKTLVGTNHTENMTWDEEVPLLACKEREKKEETEYPHPLSNKKRL